MEKAVWLYRRTADGYGFYSRLHLYRPSSGSPLNKGKAISVFREDCNITIRGNLLKFYLGGRVKYRYTINTEYDLKGVLWEYFGIAVDYPLPNGGIDQND